jgi:hypothetical protein
MRVFNPKTMKKVADVPASLDSSEAVGSTDGLELPELGLIMSPTIYQENPFGVLRLRVGASSREVSRRLQEAKVEAELQTNRESRVEESVGVVEDVKRAGQSVRSPVNRFLYEFFWPWPTRLLDGMASDEAIVAFEEMTAKGWKRAHSLWLSWTLENVGRDRARLQRLLISRHNLAVVQHLGYLGVSQSWPQVSFPSSGDYDSRRPLQAWRTIVDDENFWDLLALRIQAINEPEITSGLARRLRDSLPSSLSRVQLQHALRCSGRMSLREAEDIVAEIAVWSEAHLSQNRKDAMLADISRGLRHRIEVRVKTAEEKVEAEPAKGLTLAESLIKESLADLNTLAVLVGPGHFLFREMEDSLADCCLDAGVACQRATGDNEGLVKLAQTVGEKYSMSARLNERITKIQRTAQSNIAYRQHIEPFMEELKRVSELPDIRQRMQALHGKIVPLLNGLRERRDVDASDCSQSTAWLFRAISIAANNELGDVELALLAHKWANYYTPDGDNDLRRTLLTDAEALQGIESRRLAAAVQLEIRGTKVCIDAGRVLCGSLNARPADITSVRWGIYVYRVNGVPSYYYTVWLKTRDQSTELECKPIFRSLTEAERDFQAVVRALQVFVVPMLVKRIAQAITSNSTSSLGEPISVCTAGGLLMSKGVLMWKEEKRVAYHDLAVSYANGCMAVVCRSDQRFTASYSMRDCWNVVIFDEVVEEMKRRAAG